MNAKPCNKYPLAKLAASFLGLSLAAGATLAQAAQPFGYNKTIEVNRFTSESHPQNDAIVRKLPDRVGYIRAGSFIRLDGFNVPAGDVKPTTVSIVYASGGAGGRVEVVVYSPISRDRDTRVSLGEFNLPSTGSWNTYTQLTLPVDPSQLGYLRPVAEGGWIELQFKNETTQNYLFDVRSVRVANATGPQAAFSYNQSILATAFTSESNPEDDMIVRKQAGSVGYIKNGSSIAFEGFDASTASGYPNTATINYASGGAGGKVQFVLNSNHPHMPQEIVLGEFALPPTGGWNQSSAVTFAIPHDFYFNYLTTESVLTLRFKNPASNGYLFDISSIVIGR